MSKIYELTKQIHETLEKACEKYSIDCELESDYYFDEEGHLWNYTFELQPWEVDLSKYIPQIGEPQIRQILLVFKDVLGYNPERMTITEKEKIPLVVDDFSWGINFTKPESQAEALCEKWLGGLEPLFKTNPERVLTELLEVLKFKLY